MHISTLNFRASMPSSQDDGLIDLKELWEWGRNIQHSNNSFQNTLTSHFSLLTCKIWVEGGIKIEDQVLGQFPSKPVIDDQTFLLVM